MIKKIKSSDPVRSDNSILEHSVKIKKAIEFATKAHEGQFRRDISKSAYITHPIAVMNIISKYSQDEDLLSAALLHDVLEDMKIPYEEKMALIESQFGKRVLEIIESVSEDKDPTVVTDEKATWLDRKTKYLEKLKQDNLEALILSAADKIHNMESMISSLNEEGVEMWKKFNASQESTLWFYKEILTILESKIPNHEIVQEYRQTLENLVNISI